MPNVALCCQYPAKNGHKICFTNYLTLPVPKYLLTHGTHPVKIQKNRFQEIFAGLSQRK